MVVWDCRCRCPAPTPTRRVRRARSPTACARRSAAAPPVELYDERFTTAIAQRRDMGGGTSEDSRAAAVLLDDWLARHGHEHAGAGGVSERSETEREAARLERERRRAAAAGQSPPEPPAVPPPPAAARPRHRPPSRPLRARPRHRPSGARAPAAGPQTPGLPVRRAGTAARRARHAAPSALGAAAPASAHPPARSRRSAPRSRSCSACCCSRLLAIYTPFKDDGSGRVAVTIPAGSSAGEVGDLLADEGRRRVRASSSPCAPRSAATATSCAPVATSWRRDMSNGAAIAALTTASAASAAAVRDRPDPRGPGPARGRPARRDVRDVPGDYLAASRAQRRRCSPRELRGAARHAEPRGLPVPGDLSAAPGRATVRTLVRQQLARVRDGDRNRVDALARRRRT